MKPLPPEQITYLRCVPATHCPFTSAQMEELIAAHKPVAPVWRPLTEDERKECERRVGAKRFHMPEFRALTAVLKSIVVPRPEGFGFSDIYWRYETTLTPAALAEWLDKHDPPKPASPRCEWKAGEGDRCLLDKGHEDAHETGTGPVEKSRRDAVLAIEAEARAKQPKRRVPLGPADFPPGTAVRLSYSTVAWAMVLGCNDESVDFIWSDRTTVLRVSFEQLMVKRAHERLLPGTTEWLPCWREE